MQVSAFSGFQFHLGLIKGRHNPLVGSGKPKFQFHLGLIKGQQAGPSTAAASPFQFHLGLIKGFVAVRRVRGRVAGFNSILV